MENHMLLKQMRSTDAALDLPSPPALPESTSTADIAGTPVICSSPLLSVVIPVYNERDTLMEIVRRVRSVPINKEIILVDDGSTDGTRDLLAAIKDHADLSVLFHERNRGKGAALRTGFLHARGDIVLIQDADLEYNPDDYERLLVPILQNQADVVFGSRFKTVQARTDALWHRLGNRALTEVSNCFTGLKLTDMETCYKVFRRDILQTLAPRLEQDGFGIEPELTAKLARTGCRIREVAIRYEARSYQQGKKIGWRDGLLTLWCIWRYRRADT
jgi:glycosyltransferase involved in cell wall biosynthesis